MVVPKFHNLVLSSGSVYSSAFIGCVKYLVDMGAMDQLKTIVGASAGAILSMLLAIGMSSDEIYSFLLEHIVDKQLTDIDISSVLKLSTGFGLDDGQMMVRLFHAALESKGYDKDTTLLELVKRSGKNLVICVSNITKGCAEYLSVDTTPDVPVALALRMSCAIPLVFEPVLYNGCYYLDGAVTDGFPYAVMDSKLKDTLCILTNFKMPVFEASDQTSSWEFLYRAFVVFRETHRKLPRASENYTIVSIDFEVQDGASAGGFNIGISRADFDAHVDRGYRAIKEHFSL